jgi:toxin ParE1/3/4
MEYNLIVKPKAEKDIKKAIDWYKEQNENLPEKLFEKINESIEKLKINRSIIREDTMK